MRRIFWVRSRISRAFRRGGLDGHGQARPLAEDLHRGAAFSHQLVLVAATSTMAWVIARALLRTSSPS